MKYGMGIGIFAGLVGMMPPLSNLAATISGRVVQQGSQAGIPDLVVRFHAYGDATLSTRSIEATTDDTGLFVFDIDSSSPFYGYIHVDDEHAIYHPDGFSCRIEWDGEKQDKTLLIERLPSAVVTGRLIAASFDPVEGVVVQSVVERSAGRSIYRTETDDSGTFRIRLDAGDHDLVVDDHRHYIDPLRLTVATNVVIDTLVITTRPTSKIEGVLRNADGSPAADLGVWVGGWVHTNLIINRSRTDSNGAFFVGVPYPGPLALGIKAILDSNHQTLLTNLIVRADEAPASVTITLPSGSLSGLVRLDPTRTQMAMISIEAKTPPRTWMSTTDMEGNYQFPWLDDGEYIITVIGPGSSYNLLRRSFLVQDGQATTGADFAPGDLVLCGQVFGPGGNPVTNGHVEVRSESRPSYVYWKSTTEIGSDGRFCASNLYPGVVTIMAVSQGCLYEKSDVVLSAPRHDQVLASFGTNTWAGYLIDERGQGISQGFVRVFARHHDGLIINRFAMSDEAGRFSIENLPDGRCILVAQGPAGITPPMTRTFPDMSITNQAVTIPTSTGYIEGRILSMFEFGTPFDISRDIENGFTLELPASTRADGYYRIDHLPDGDYQMNIPTMSGIIHHPVRIEQGAGVRADFAVQTTW